MKVQTSIFEDDLELVNPKTGEVERSIHFRLNLAAMYDKIAVKKEELAAVNPENVEQLGQKTIELFDLIFGEDAISDILDYYRQDYIAMIGDLTTPICDVIYPALDQYRARLMDAKKRVKRG